MWLKISMLKQNSILSVGEQCLLLNINEKACPVHLKSRDEREVSSIQEIGTKRRLERILNSHMTNGYPKTRPQIQRRTIIYCIFKML